MIDDDSSRKRGQLPPGERLGQYEVVALIGAGGMGQVYRARDTRLGRDVALKILPDAVAQDDDRLARFEREAQILASLNHPNIAAIYGVVDIDVIRDDTGSARRLRALVMELVEGPTLADRIMRGRLAMADALSIARQIAVALDAAHEHGIVHRDLKPANITIRTDDTVKVLDFGLAKVEGSAANSDTAASPTVTAATREGIILGTAAYMSPEQARGQRIDKRTDVWAFGCVCYEMLTGQRAFAGTTTTDTIAAILEREPDWGQLPAETPLILRRLLRRCLEKDPRRRWRDMADARIELESPDDDHTGQRPAVRRSFALAVAAAAVALVVAMTALSRSEAPVAPDYTQIVRLTSGPAKEVGPAISPDGKWVAYVSDAGGAANVWVKFLNGGDAANITAASDLEISSGTGIGGLEISPDGTRIAVMARRRGSTTPFAVWELPAPLPGRPRKLLDDNHLGMRWSPDGRRITFIAAGSASGDALLVADADGTNRRQLIAPRDGMHIHWPHWAADNFIYFIRTFTTVINLDQSEIYRTRPDGDGAFEPVVATIRRALHPLPLSLGLVYSANPRTAEMRLWWRSWDGRQQRQLTTGVGDYMEPRASSDGRTIVSTLYDFRQSLERITMDSRSVNLLPLTDGYQGDLDPSLSPPGDRLAFSSSRDGNRHVWVAALDGSDARPLTSGTSEDDRPAWSHDGRQIAFTSDRGGARSVWVVAADGGSPRKVIEANLSGGVTWSRDGEHLVYGAGAGGGPGLWKVPVAGGAPTRIPTTEFASEPAWAPTRDVIAYMSTKRVNDIAISGVGFVDPNGQTVYALPDPPLGNGFSNGVLAWSPDGRRVAVVRQQSNSAASIWIVDPESSGTLYSRVIDFPPGPRIRGIAWTRANELIIGKHDWTSDIVLLTQN